MEQVQLKPCPFCSGEANILVIEPHTHCIAKFIPDYPGGAFVECSGCTCVISAVSEKEAVEAWNRRANND